MIQQIIELTARRAFFETYFKNPRQVRYGVWLVTSFGDCAIDEEVRHRAALSPGATMFSYADALIEYGNSEGWGEELSALLRQDLEAAFNSGETMFDTRGNRKYLKSRFAANGSLEGASKDRNDA
jgi:hypothetical protein